MTLDELGALLMQMQADLEALALAIEAQRVALADTRRAFEVQACERRARLYWQLMTTVVSEN